MNTENSKQLVKQKDNQLSKKDNSPSERFTQAVMREFPTGGDEKINLTAHQKKLIQNYFIKLDGTLKDSELKRYAPNNSLEYNWNNINMNKLAQDVVAYSSIGLDPLQKNHINPIPYHNKKSGKYDVTFIEGFNGLELKAKKYGFEVPDDVIFELKYSTDKFKSLKKNINREIESYEFEVTNDFDRGELEGGFYYMIYKDNPERNQLIVMNRRQIEKRRPEYAAAEFWGGEKDNWEYDQAQNKKVKNGKIEVEGWEEEMFLKTLKRHCWNSINIDSQKIDDFLMRVIENESQSTSRKLEEEVKTKANKRKFDTIDIEDAEYEEEGNQQVAEEDTEAENERLYAEAMAEEEGQSSMANSPGFGA